MKPQRWYEVEDEAVYIYDAPYPAKAGSVSIVKPSDMPYYRSRFHLERCWMEVK